MERVIEQGYEAESQVKITSRFIDGIDLDGSNPNLLSQFLGSFQGVDQEQGSKPLSPNALIDREPPEQNHWYVDPRKSLGLVVRQVRSADSMAGDRVIPQNRSLPITHRHEGSRQVPLVKLTGLLLQPIIERVVTAVERSPVVLTTES
jgi:hypothetical protein